MKTKHFLLNIFACIGMLTLLLLTSCAPEVAVDEIKNKLHEDPVKAVFTLQEGTLKGGKQFSTSLVLGDFQPSSTPAQQIIWQITPKGGWHVTSNQTHFKVMSVKQHPRLVYRLSIDYYNSKGEKINQQFFNAGQDKIHQHFFSLYESVTIMGKQGLKRVKDKSKLPYDYCYVDQLNGTDIGTTNPIGFIGLLQIIHPEEAFNLSVDLLHAAQSKYDASNKPSPFYLPSKLLTSTGQWDINVKLPFDVDNQVAVDAKATNKPLPFHPKTVEIAIYSGHLHGYQHFHQDPISANNKFIGKCFHLIYTLNGNRWVADKNNPAIVNLLGTSREYRVCAFALRYYDAQHHDITGKIVEQGESQHYQHFFTVSNIQPAYGGVSEKTDNNTTDFFDYTYCDTNPWNKTNRFDDAEFVGDDNPIGLKGYFCFKRSHKSFTLNIQLMRAKHSKLVDGEASPFNAPSAQQYSKEDWMPTIHIPVKTYMDVDEKQLIFPIDDYAEKIETIQWNDLPDADKIKVQSLMKAFDIKDFHEALAEFYWINSGQWEESDNGFWF